MVKHLFFACLLIFLAASTALAGDDDWADASDDQFLGSRDQLAVRVGLRTDESQSVDAQPEMSLKYFRWLSRFTALTVDFGFTNQSNFSWKSEARTFALGAGMRLQEPGSLFSVFLEPGLSFQRHSGDLNGADFTETRIGLGISMGISFDVYKHTALDVCFRQVLNAGPRPVYAVTPTVPMPPIDQSHDYLGGADSYDLYNPTHLIVSYRIGL